MRSTKYIIALFLIFLLSFPVTGGERPKPKLGLIDKIEPTYLVSRLLSKFKKRKQTFPETKWMELDLTEQRPKKEIKKT